MKSRLCMAILLGACFAQLLTYAGADESPTPESAASGSVVAAQDKATPEAGDQAGKTTDGKAENQAEDSSNANGGADADSKGNDAKAEDGDEDNTDKGDVEGKDSTDEFEDEEGDDEDEEENPQAAVESVTKEIETAIKENSADDLLNLATEAKLSAESILDLTKVIAYCVEAEKKGLADDGLEFCKQLKLSAQLERGLTLSKMFMVDDLSFEDLPRGWNIIRLMALEDLETVVEAIPATPLAQLAIGRLQLLPDGDENKAREAFDMVIANDDEADPEVLVEALKYRSMLEDDSDKCLELLNRALEISQDNPTLLNYLAVEFTETHQDERALETIKKAIEAEPNNATFKKTKARILAAMDQVDEAEKLFDEAINEDGNRLTGRLEKGQFLFSIGEYQKAIDFYTELIKDTGPLPTILYLRGAARIQAKDETGALKDINKAIGLNPSFEEAVRLKALLYIQMKKYPEGIRLLEKLRSKNPDDEVIAAQLARALADSGKFSEGIDRLNKLLEKKPGNQTLLRGKADMYLSYAKWEEAIATYEEIIKEHPGDSGSLNNYAWLLATSPEDSIRNGQKALELAKLAAEKTNYRESYILSTLAAAYAESGDFEKAREWSEKAVALAEKEKEERLDDLKNELESYRKNEPWRETPPKAGEATEAPADSEEEESEFF